jgi:hypothetical protein
MAQRAGRRFVAATPISANAEQLEVDTGQPVMALGGFTGSDPVPDLDHLTACLRSDEVATFVIFQSDLRVPAKEFVIRSDLVTWLRAHCKPVGPLVRAVGNTSPASPCLSWNCT